MSKIDNGWRTGKNGKYNIYWNNKKTKLSKKLYARLAHTINTYPTKWRKGLNIQIIGDKEITFDYDGFDNFEIKGARKYE